MLMLVRNGLTDVSLNVSLGFEKTVGRKYGLPLFSLSSYVKNNSLLNTLDACLGWQRFN